MKTYQCILFDADETLFRYDAFAGLQRLFARLGVPFTRDDYLAYEAINKPLWVEYQKGVIDADQVKKQRFESWAAKLNASAIGLNSAFMAVMAEISTPLEGALSLLTSLKGKAKVGIITNGFSELQQPRLERAGLQDHIDLLVVSEEVGHAKPHPGIFEHALSLAGNPAPEQVLMVGDNPESDILGGMNAGLDTCWLNVNDKPLPEGVTPHYQVSSLRELEILLQTKL